MGEEFEEAVWGEVPTIGKLASLKMMQMTVGRMWPGGILGSVLSVVFTFMSS
jgi:hypothetical protein